MFMVLIIRLLGIGNKKDCAVLIHLVYEIGALSPEGKFVGRILLKRP